MGKWFNHLAQIKGIPNKDVVMIHEGERLSRLVLVAHGWFRRIGGLWWTNDSIEIINFVDKGYDNQKLCIKLPFYQIY